MPAARSSNRVRRHFSHRLQLACRPVVPGHTRNNAIAFWPARKLPNLLYPSEARTVVEDCSAARRNNECQARDVIPWGSCAPVDPRDRLNELKGNPPAILFGTTGSLSEVETVNNKCSLDVSRVAAPIKPMIVHQRVKPINAARQTYQPALSPHSALLHWAIARFYCRRRSRHSAPPRPQSVCCLQPSTNIAEGAASIRLRHVPSRAGSKRPGRLQARGYRKSVLPHARNKGFVRETHYLPIQLWPRRNGRYGSARYRVR